MPTFADVYGEKYLLLTTFTKDGRPKPTPVWGVPDGDKLLISTDDGSWKTRPKSETRRVFEMVTRRYWWHAWWWVPQALLRGGIDRVHAAIEVEATRGRSGATGESDEGQERSDRGIGRGAGAERPGNRTKGRSGATGESEEA